jgi:penicillin-binding protein activator
MFNNFKVILSTIVISTCLTACSSTPVKVDVSNDTASTVMGLDYRDFSEASTKMVESILKSPALIHPDGDRYVLAISKILNDTMQRIDTDQLVKKIRVELLNSGRVVVTSAVSGNGAEDAMSYELRKLRDNEEFNQKTISGKGNLVAPDFSLSGKILQRNNSVNSRTTQVDYYFQLTLTNVENGLAYWEGEVPIIKRGSSKTVSW